VEEFLEKKHATIKRIVGMGVFYVVRPEAIYRGPTRNCNECFFAVQIVRESTGSQ
jgi:hypothetical protein